MKKVYCKNCRYFILVRDAYGKRNWPECRLTKEKTITWEKVQIVFGLPPSTINRKNDCLNYKRKWWKFCVA
jgi:hypothetical protein